MTMVDLNIKDEFCTCCGDKAVLLVTTGTDLVDCAECDSIVSYCKKHACELTCELLDALNPLCIEEMINEK